MTARAGSRVGWGQSRCALRLAPKLGVGRLTTWGLERRRRTGGRRSGVSRRPAVTAAARWSGGEGRLRGGLASCEAEGVGEGGPVGIDVGQARAVVREGADGVVEEKMAPDLLFDAIG